MEGCALEGGVEGVDTGMRFGALGTEGDRETERDMLMGAVFCILCNDLDGVLRISKQLMPSRRPFSLSRSVACPGCQQLCIRLVLPLRQR